MNTMVRAAKPSLEVAEDAVDVWSNPVCSFRCSDNPDAMLVADQCLIGISSPTIGSKRCAKFDILCQKVTNTDLPCVIQNQKSKSSSPLAVFAIFVLVGENLDRAEDQTLVSFCYNASSTLAFCWSADDRFICFDQARKTASVLVNHPFTQSMQHVPSRCITTNPKLPLELNCANPRRMGRNEIGGPKPFLNWDMGSMHQGASRGRCLPSALLALKNIAFRIQPCRLTRALRTNETIEPAALSQVCETGFWCGEAPTKLQHVLRIFWP